MDKESGTSQEKANSSEKKADADIDDKKTFKVPSDIYKRSSDEIETPQTIDDFLPVIPLASEIADAESPRDAKNVQEEHEPSGAETRRVSFADDTKANDEKSSSMTEDFKEKSSFDVQENAIENLDKSIEDNTRGSTSDSPDIEKPIKDIRKRREPVKRPSVVRRKIIEFEKELTLENINKKVTRVFTPDISRKDSESEIKEQDVKKPSRRYLSSAMACIFLMSIITGSGIVSLPFYLKKSTWFGVFIIILLGLNSMYGGFCIAWSWILMEEKWPEYSEYSRVPYQEIAYRASGTFMKYVVALCIDVSVIGTCAVYLILVAESIENLTYNSLHFCYVMIIVAAILLPFTMFGSYRNIKYVGILDVVLSILFTCFLVLSFFLDKPMHGSSTYSDPDSNSFVLAFAGISFSYACGPIFSSILLDMEDRTLFTQSCATAYIGSMTLYIVVAIMGYAAYGDKTPRYILRMILTNKTYRPMGIFILVLYILQILTSFVCFLIPSLHAFEVRFKCPDRFCIGRFIVRFLIVVAILLLTEGVPYMSSYMELVGATLTNLLTYIFPPIFYLCLVYQQGKNSKRYISKKEWILMVETVVIGIVVAVVTTITRYEGVKHIIDGRPSCYANLTRAVETKPWIALRRQ